MNTTDKRRGELAAMIPETMKRPDLVELIDSLAKFGTKDQRSDAQHAPTNAARRKAIVTLALQGQKRKRTHALSLGFAFCKVEAGIEHPTLVELLTTPTTASGTVTCAKCLALMGVDELDADEQAAEDAEVEAARVETAKRNRREARKATRDAKAAELQAVEVEAPQAVEGIEPAAECQECGHPGMAHDFRTRKCAQCERCAGFTEATAPAAPACVLDDGHGTELADAASSLPITFPYKGATTTARLRSTGEVEMHDGTMHASPSAAGGAITGGAVNGWRRWRYVGRHDDLTYPIARLRGEDHPAIRVGKTGRKPSKASALARHAGAQAKAAKLRAKLDAAELLVSELTTKHGQAVALVEGLATAARELGAEVGEGDDSDLFPVDAETPAPSSGGPLPARLMARFA